MMNEKQMREILETAATQITPDARFTSELEEKLIKAHKTKERFFMFKNKNLISTLGFIGAIALLLLALNWAFRSLAPKTIPGAGKTPSPTSLENTPAPQSTPNEKSYDFRGTKLYLKQPLPESPTDANIYLLNKAQPTTPDEARALAQRFGIQSEGYTQPGQVPNTTDYVFTDGKQKLIVHSNFDFAYIADIAKNNDIFSGAWNQSQNAEATITGFLKSRGFDFPVKIEVDELLGGYIVHQLAPDGIPMQYEYYALAPLQVKLDESGQVFWLQASLMDFNQTPVGTFGIIGADEALKKMLDDTIQAEKIEFMGSKGGGGGGGGLGFYQLNLSGTPMPFPAATAIPTKALGIQYTIKATDTLSEIASKFGISVDTLTQANNISDPSMIYVGQVLTIPGTILQPTVGQKIEKLHGTISIIIHKKTDGSQQTDYNLFTSNNQFPHILLEGADTQILQDNNARPVDVWGTVDHFAQDGTPVVKVDQLGISYPGLKFQILRGTQKSAEVQGQPVIIFTADDGSSYVQVNPDGTPDVMLTAGTPGDPILIETLVIPGEKFGDYPTIHVYQASMAINPKNGQPMEMQITADQPQVMDEAQTQQLPPGATPPANLTIEKVELVYYVSNPLYQGSDINAIKHLPYIQPAWHFSGHYSNGDKFDMLIQALKQEFLSPEVLPVIPPG